MPTLRELKAEAEEQYGGKIQWYDSAHGAYADLPEGGTVSIMLDPPDGTSYISGWGKGWTTEDGENDDSPEDDDCPDFCIQIQKSDDAIASLDSYVKLTTTGAIIDPDVPFDLWEQGVGDLFSLVKALPWILGDLLLFGEHKWGEMYSQAVEMTGLSYSTLSQYVRVAKAIPYARRRAGVPWTAHKHVAALDIPQQQKILDLAESGELENTTEVKEKAQEAKAPEQTAEERPPCPLCGASISKTQCGFCRADFLKLVWYIHDLHGELRGFRETGEFGKLMRAILEADQ